MEEPAKVHLPEFFFIPSIIFTDPNTKNLDGFVYAVIYWTSKLKLQKCIMSNQGIADMLGSSASSVANSISRLSKAGYIHVVLDENRQRTELIPLVVLGKKSYEPEVPSGSDGVSPTGEGGFHPQVKGVSPTGEHNNNNYNKNNKNNTNAENTKSGKVENSVENSEPSTASEPSRSTPPDNLTAAAKDILSHFNDVFGSRYRSVKALLSNLEYWLEEYTVEDIQQAISNAKSDSFWAGKLTPVILLRRRNPNGENVDYIGQFLNKAQPIDPKPEEATPVAVWEMAMKYNVPMKGVVNRLKYIMESLQNDTFYERPGRDKMTVMQALERWVQIDLDRGKLKTCNEIERIDLENGHPEKVAERKVKLDMVRAYARQKGWYD